MKYLITTIAVVVLVGCGESQEMAPAEVTRPVDAVPSRLSSPAESQLTQLVAEAANEPSDYKAPAIHLAVRDGKIEVVRQHLEAGADVNIKDNIDSTLLHFASINGRKKIAELLIAKGADVNAQDHLNLTPLDNAIFGKRSEIVDLLLIHGGKTGKELPWRTIEDSTEFETGTDDDLIGVDEDGDGFDAYDEKIAGHSDNDPDDKPTQEEVDAALAELEAAGN